MRTVHLPAGPQPAVTVTGGASTVQINRDGSGTITYSGTLTLNGVTVRSPQQLLERWRSEGERAISLADRADRLGQTAVLDLAKGQALAYGHMLDVARQCLNGGASVTEVGRALEVLRDQVAEKLPKPAGADRAAAFAEARLVLAEGFVAWQTTARFQWSNDHA